MIGNHPAGSSSQDLDRPANTTRRGCYLSLEKLARFQTFVIKNLSLLWVGGVIFLPEMGLAQPLEIVVVGRTTCRALTAHHPAPDVAYRPGIDVHGNPVAPADLPATPTGPDMVRVALKRDMPVGAGALGASEIVVGEVKVDLLTGKATLDGKPLDPNLQSDVVLACSRR